MEEDGAKRVEIIAKDDKRQITAVFCGSLTGEFCPYSWFMKERQINVYLNLIFHQHGTSHVHTITGQMR